ncbi:MAG: hypothetical protein ACREYB_11555, partial [Casimicrobiaceae bacterium]
MNERQITAGAAGGQGSPLPSLCDYRPADSMIASLRIRLGRMPRKPSHDATAVRSPRGATAARAAIVAPNAPAVTPASEIDALTGDPNFMSSLAR